MKNRYPLVAAGFAAALFSLPAAAQLSSSAFYAGARAGSTHFNDVCANGVQCKSRDPGGGVFGGLQFSRYLALEAAATYLGHGEVGGANFKGNTIELDGVLTLPIYKGFSALGRVGAFHGTLKSDSKSESKNGVTYGWGGQYDFGPAFALRLEFQRYPSMGGDEFGAKTDVDTITLGALLRFR